MDHWLTLVSFIHLFMKLLVTNCHCRAITFYFSLSWLTHSLKHLLSSHSSHSTLFLACLQHLVLTTCTSWSGSCVVLPRLPFQLLVPGHSVVLGLVKRSLCMKCHLPDDMGIVIYRKVLGCFEVRWPLRASTLLLFSSPLWQSFCFLCNRFSVIFVLVLVISHHVSFCSTYCNRTVVKQLTPFFLPRRSHPPPPTPQDSCILLLISSIFLKFSSFTHWSLPKNKQPVTLHFSICPDFFSQFCISSPALFLYRRVFTSIPPATVGLSCTHIWPLKSTPPVSLFLSFLPEYQLLTTEIGESTLSWIHFWMYSCLPPFFLMSLR